MTPLTAVSWNGGKAATGTGIGPWVASRLPAPESRQLYCEPYAGMLGVLLQREAAGLEIVNDLDDRVVGWWRAVREHPDEIDRRLRFMPWSRREFERQLCLVDDRDPITRAVALTVVWVQGWAGAHAGAGKGWRRQKEGQSPARGGQTRYDFRGLAKRLHRVQLECRPALEVLEFVADVEDAVIYVDPPYPSVGGTSLYRVNEGDWDELLQVLLAQRGRVAVSGYAGDGWDPLIAAGWELDLREVSAGHVSGHGYRKALEVLVRNYCGASGARL